MANQITIDIGAAANDGTGDPLRTAFNYVNNNFSNVWNTGLPNSNIQFSDNRILTVNTNANLVLAPNGIGKVASNVDIVPNTANVFSLGGTTRRWNTVYTQYLDVSNYISGTLGNITVAVANLHITGGSNGYVLQTDGAGNLTWTAQTGGSGNGTPGGANTQVQYNNAGSFGGSAAFTFDRTSNVLTVSGNISSGNIAITNLTSSNTVSARTATFTGDQYSDGAIYVGTPAGTVLGSDVVMQITANAGGYSQTNFQNINSGPTASSDYILTADNGNDTTHYLDMGITSSGWDGSETNVLSGLAANNGYLYVQDGNLSLGVRNGNTSYKWNFDTTGLLTVPGNIIPTGNATQSLGNATRQWKDLWVSNNTIYINSVPLSMTAGNILTVNGEDVVTTNANGTVDLANLAIDNYNIYNTQGGGLILSNFNYLTAEAETAYINIPAGNSPGDLQIVQEQGNVTINANSRALWSFNADNSFKLPNNSNITIADNTVTQINSVATANGAINLRTFDATGNIGASTYFDGASGSLDFYSFNYTTNSSYNWRFDNGGSFTLPNSPGNVYFGEQANGPVIIPGATAITLNANRADTTQDYITVGQDGIELFSVNTINIDNSTTGLLNSDINIRSGDDIFLRGRNKPDDTESEGGDIFVYAGQGANAATGGNDTGGGGDIQIYAGAGGLAQVTNIFGGSGGTIDILAGDGGTSLDSLVGSGGWISLTAGSAATPVDSANGGFGGSVSITAGATTRINESGGSISLNTGAGSGDGYGAAGAVEINIATSNVGPGGTWTFSGTGTTFQVPANSEIYGANFGNFTVGCAGNTIVTSSDYGANVKNWVFGYTGNLLAPGNIITPTNFVGPSLRTNLADFNFVRSITNIATGATTVVSLAGLTFGDPWTGQVTISDVTGTTEANGTWWYQAVDTDQIGLYTDNTFTTPVDSSTWGAYVSGGLAVTLDYGNIQINAQTVTIQSGDADYNNKVWEFDNTGTLTFPSLANISGGNFNAGTASATVALNAFSPDGNTVSIQSQGNTSSAVISIFSNAGPVTSNWTFTTAPLDPTESFLYIPNGGAISTPDATGGEGGKNIFIQAGASDPVTWNSNPGGEIIIKGGYGSFGDGGGGAGGNVNIQGGPSSDSHAGNVNINSGLNTWVFDYTGKLTVPGISTGSGTGEIVEIRGTRNKVGITNDAGYGYAATFTGTTPALAYTASSNLVQSAKVTFVVQSNNATFGWEQFDVSVIILYGGGVGVTVSNRMNNNPANGDTQVTASVNGGGQIEIYLAQPGSGTAYVNYTATEFNLMID